MTARGFRLAAAVTLSALMATAVPQGAAAFSLPFLGGQEKAPPPGPPRAVVTEIVADRPATERSTPGVIASATEVQMAFQTLGRLVERNVDVGDRVAQGDILARLDPEDLAGSVRAAEAALAAAEVNLNTARGTAERTRALAGRNVASRAQLERAEQGLTTAQSSADQARAGLERARNAESFAVMTAPISGVVSAVRATPGAVVAAGDPILTLAAETGLEATIDLPELQLAGIGPGTTFLVWRDHADAQPTRGTVDRIAPVADAKTRTRRVYIKLDDATGFRLGSLIRARLNGSDGAILTVPLAAVMREGGAQAGEMQAVPLTQSGNEDAGAATDAADTPEGGAGSAASPADTPAPDTAPEGADPEDTPPAGSTPATTATANPAPEASDAPMPATAAAPDAADTASAAPPASATPSPTPQTASVWVVTRTADGATVALQPVTLGATFGDRVEVTSGLSAGAEVVIRGVHSLTDGQPVGRRLDHP